MTSKAFDNATDANRQQGGRRNLIINGAMQVAQRGTSFTVNTSNNDQYTLDRMRVYCVGGAEVTVTQDSDAPDVFTNSFKITNSTAQTTDATDYTVVNYVVEGYDMSSTGMGTSAAKDVTLSFWVKSSVTGTYGLTIRAGNASTANYTASYSIDSANTWEQKTITFPATSSGTWNTTNGIGGDVLWDLGVGSDYSQTAGSWNTSGNKFGLTSGTKLTETASATWQITGVQLEVGTVATPFEHRSYGEELALCQRYYQKFVTPFNMFAAHQTNQVYGVRPLFQEMRATPTSTNSAESTFTIIGNNEAASPSGGLDGVNTASNSSVEIYANGTFTLGRAYFMRGNDPSAYIDYDAEL